MKWLNVDPIRLKICNFLTKYCFLIVIFSNGLHSEELSIPLSVAVIGSGPAGLSAALVTGRDQVTTHLFLGHRPGGPLNAKTGLGNWPGSIKGGGSAVISRLFEQLKRFDIELDPQALKAVDFSVWPFRLESENGTVYFAKTIIVATGATPRRLNVPGELKYWNKGIETALYKSDAMRFKDKTVAVVGGGIDAAKKAAILAKMADKVYLIVRGSQMQKPFFEQEMQKRGHGKIEVRYNSRITKILGDSAQLTQLDLEGLSGKETVKVDAIVLAIGIVPNSSLFRGKLELDESDFIVVKGRTQATSVPGVFAAGNVVDNRHYGQAAISAGEGMKAGYDALEFLNSISQSQL